jgi:hypothetical protein
MKPCPEFEASLLTAISNPSGSWPWEKYLFEVRIFPDYLPLSSNQPGSM